MAKCENCNERFDRDEASSYFETENSPVITCVRGCAANARCRPSLCAGQGETSVLHPGPKDVCQNPEGNQFS